MISKAVCFLVLALGCRAFAATNEYYSSPVVKGIVDSLIKAYGGEEKLKQFERIKIVMDVKEGAMTVKGTLYQTATKARLDMELTANQRKAHLINLYDGKEFVSLVNGQAVPMKASMKEQLERSVKEGVFQAAILDEFLNKKHDVLYRGKKTYDGKTYEVIESRNEWGITKEHYIDPEKHREIVEIKRDKEGVRTHVFEAFDEFEGVLYQKRALVKGTDGSLRGSWAVKEISKDFEDSVFDTKKL